MAVLFLDLFGSDPSKMDQTGKFGEQTSWIQAQRAWFLVYDKQLEKYLVEIIETQKFEYEIS